MPLQNRVNPYGEIVANAARGAWMGNRGCIHGNDRQLTSKRWTRKAWIICELSYRGLHRNVMAPGEYTELFFLDEATALAAGHCPCGTCRKAALNDLVAAWRSTGGLSDSGLSVRDDTLHSQRTAVIGKAALPSTDLASIPNGCMIALERGGDAYLVSEERLLKWSFSGYVRGPDIARNMKAILITPPVIKEIIAHGYSPQEHHSASLVRQGL